MQAYLGKPYARNGKGPEAYGCFGLIWRYCKDLGVAMPSECWTLRGSWTIDNYGDLIDLDRPFAESVMWAVLERIGTPVKPALAVAGDVLVVRHHEGGIFPAIYSGNGHAIGAFLAADVRAFALDGENYAIAARRVR
jgi:hypothetical protein